MREKVLALYKQKCSSYDIQVQLGISSKEIYHYVEQAENAKNRKRIAS